MNFMLPTSWIIIMNVVVSGIVLTIVPLIIIVVILVMKRHGCMSFLSGSPSGNLK